MPHESTVDPEEPMHFKSWGDETTESDSPDRRRSTYGQITASTPRINHPPSIQTHPDLPLHVTHDHDDDPDDDGSTSDAEEEIDYRTKPTYTPPQRQIDPTTNGEMNAK
jgi:hypothetical protein